MTFYTLPDLCSDSFWCRDEYDAIRLDAEEIKKLNNDILRTPETGMSRLCELPKTYKGIELRERLADFEVEKQFYINGIAVTDEYYSKIRSNILNAKAYSQMKTYYGRCRSRTVIKKYPYGDFLSDSKEYHNWDEFALTELLCGENVVIYLTSADKEYYYITAECYSGWVASNDIEICGTLRKTDEEFIPYTVNNVIRVAFEKLGTPYGWGGTNGGTDCSGFVRGVYRRFGINLPRDCSTQAKIPVKKHDLSALTEMEKKMCIDKISAGAILQFPGHEMIYLGKYMDSYFVINAANKIVDPREPDTVIYPRAVIINTLSMMRPDKTIWLSNLQLALEI
ncbi:MAG: SH3 domain-containing protein [Oscillospiraceae bacterium]|nr:SH3 domain-containing protein [Oscillospiraceae bacterium]